MGSLIPDEFADPDTSVIIGLVTQDASTARAEVFIRTDTTLLLTSDLAAAELASAVSRLVRTKDITKAQAAGVFRKFDQWRYQTMALSKR